MPVALLAAGAEKHRRQAMLVLRRNLGERILIRVKGVEVQIMLVEIVGGGAARLGITAPSEVKIAREEVAEHIFNREEP